MDNNVLAYTQALADGELLDVSELGRDVGFEWPVSIAKAVHTAVARQAGDRVEEGLWQLLFSARLQAVEFAKANGAATELEVHAVVGARRGQGIVVRAQLVVGVDDETNRPCIVLVKPASLEKPGE